MKNLCIILTALTAGTAPILSQVASPSIESVQETVKKNGQEAMSSLRKSFENGAFDTFLKEMDESYQTAKENGGLASLGEMRLGEMPDIQTWEDRAISLQNEKSKELALAIEDQPKSPFVEKVLFAAADLSDRAHQDAITWISNLRALAPGAGKNNDENRLIDLDLEYEYKLLHLSLPGSSVSERREKQCALKMEKLRKMVSSPFEDASVQKKIALYAEGFDARLAQSWDIADLNELVNGKAKPGNALEEKVALILKAYQDKFSELSRQFMAEHEKG